MSDYSPPVTKHVRLSFFFGSPPARLEPELELFEVDDIGNNGDDDLNHHSHYIWEPFPKICS